MTCIELFDSRLLELGLSWVQSAATFETIKIENPDIYSDLEKDTTEHSEDDLEWYWAHVSSAASIWILETEGKKWQDRYHEALDKSKYQPQY